MALRVLTQPVLACSPCSVSYQKVCVVLAMSSENGCYITGTEGKLSCASSQEAYNAEHYTQGLDHIASTNLMSLLIRHYPELETSIGKVPGSNAFYRWQGAPAY